MCKICISQRDAIKRKPFLEIRFDLKNNFDHTVYSVSCVGVSKWNHYFLIIIIFYTYLVFLLLHNYYPSIINHNTKNKGWFIKKYVLLCAFEKGSIHKCLRKYLYALPFKDGFRSEDTGEFLHCQHKYSKSLSCAENLNFLPKTVNNLFKFFQYLLT